MTVGFIFDFIRVLCEALTIAIILRAILSWIYPAQTNTLAMVLFRLTEPLLAPLRRILPRYGALDFSPFLAIVLLQLIAWLLPRW